ncbi:hypothetical protein VUR80DRAFT_81 [Thermomyces stellatus]
MVRRTNVPSYLSYPRRSWMSLTGGVAEWAAKHSSLLPEPSLIALRLSRRSNYNILPRRAKGRIQRQRNGPCKDSLTRTSFQPSRRIQLKLASSCDWSSSPGSRDSPIRTSELRYDVRRTGCVLTGLSVSALGPTKYAPISRITTLTYDVM